MSAIVGLYNSDGKPVDKVDVSRMLDSLAHRGPDGAGLWSDGSIGLGHRMLWTTPESLQEKLPLVSQTGDLVLTADARIDNRDELISRLGLTDHPSGEIADSQFILAAYEKWGEDCAEKLLGDFAFVIWDARKQKLFCARDPMGVKPFYYYHSDKVFVFASEIKALFCLPEVPRRLNEVRIADYIIKTFEDKVITFYKDIFRVPPAHSLTVNNGAIRIRSYWTPDLSSELRLGSDEEYADALREVFTEAVRCRLRSSFPMGSFLSGGLDSSSIACTARTLLAQNDGQRMHTYSAIFPSVAEEDPRIDERRYMKAVLSGEGFEPHYVYTDRLNPMGSFLWNSEEAVPAPNLFMDEAIFSAAHQQNNRVILSGFDGDSVVSYGYEYFLELFRNLQWKTMVIEAAALANKLNPSFPTWRGARIIIWKYGIRPLIPEPAVKTWRILRRRTQPVWGDNSLINPVFAKRIGLSERAQSLLDDGSSLKRNVREEHYLSLTSGLLNYALELLDNVASTHSVETRYPFFDRRLMEFCMTLPPKQKLHQGRTRDIMRRAMSGILPREVQWRFEKSNLIANFNLKLLEFNREILEDVILNDSKIIEEYADVPALRTAYHRYRSQPLKTSDDSGNVFLLVTLALWLRQSGLTI